MSQETDAIEAAIWVAENESVRHDGRDLHEVALEQLEALQAALAESTRAREQAENEHEETLRDLDVRGQQLDGAVAAAADLKRKRDEHKAAREQAEECASELRAQYAEKSEALILAERERDALKLSRDQARGSEAQALAELDTALAQIDECAAAGDANFARAEQAERERDAALARVNEWQGAHLDAQERGAREAVARRAAETALASARKLLYRVTGCVSDKLLDEIEAWLTSHPSPAPVAAPSVVIPTENQAWAVLDRFFGSHENDAENRSDDAHVEAYAAYRVIAESRDLATVAPVAAPCATEELIDYLEAAARDLPLEQFLITMRRKLMEALR